MNLLSVLTTQVSLPSTLSDLFGFGKLSCANLDQTVLAVSSSSDLNITKLLIFFNLTFYLNSLKNKLVAFMDSLVNKTINHFPDKGVRKA